MTVNIHRIFRTGSRFYHFFGVLPAARAKVLAGSLACVVAGGLLAGCGAGSVKPVEPSPQASGSGPEAPKAESLAAEAGATKTAVAAPGPTARQRLVSRLLDGGFAALSADQLTTPEHDNAVDRFRAVLIVQPENAQAQSGLDMVVRRYCQLAQSAIEQGNFPQAQVYIASAKRVDRVPMAVAQVEQALKAAKQQAAQVASKPVLPDSRAQEIKIPQNALAARADSLVQALAQLAERVKSEDLYVLIVARSDADGRWIYQTMKQALPGYRLRGNIERGSEPKIVLQAPIS